MPDANPVLLRAAFELGRAHNDFRFQVFNVILGGIPGKFSLEPLDRIYVHLEAVSATEMDIDYHRLLDEFRLAWVKRFKTLLSQTIHQIDSIISIIEGPDGRSHYKILFTQALPLLTSSWSGLDNIIRCAIHKMGADIKVAYKFGRLLDQGLRPLPMEVETDEPSDPEREERSPVRTDPTVAILILVPDPKLQDWRSEWEESNPHKLFVALVPESRPFEFLAEPSPLVLGPLPMPRGWFRRIRTYWDLLGLHQYCPVPDLERLSAGSIGHRVHMVQFAVLQVASAFDAMRATPTTQSNIFLSNEQRYDLLDKENVERLSGCPQPAREAFVQYELAARRISEERGGETEQGRANSVTDKEAHQWLRERPEVSGAGPKMRKLGTWQRQLRVARNWLGVQKHKPRTKPSR